MICRKCNFVYERRTIGFKAVCENCGEYLHSCRNCSLYDAGAGRCRSLTTDAVSSIISNNYCEEFVPNKKTSAEEESPHSKTSGDFDALFN